MLNLTYFNCPDTDAQLGLEIAMLHLFHCSTALAGMTLSMEAPPNAINGIPWGFPGSSPV